MADLRFSACGSDRRRRMLVNDSDSCRDVEIEEAVPISMADSGAAAFPLLTRDRLIRRFISPRLWKHAVLASFWTLLPVAVAVVWMASDSERNTSVPDTHVTGMVSILRGLSGLELFLASQCCLLICWVRGASAVDFRGGDRSWRWMSGILLFASLMLVTGASFAMTDLIAGWLTPILGAIRSARPALLFVPVGAFTVFVLRFLIPDMSRCRSAQGLAIAGATLALVRIIAGLRGPMSIPMEALALLELLTAGLVLSAFELHCRYVIHVNPDPPMAVRQREDSEKSKAGPIKRDSDIEPILTEPVHVSGRDDAATTATCTATTVIPPLPSSPGDTVIPPNGQTSGGGGRTSRKKQRKAG